MSAFRELPSLCTVLHRHSRYFDEVTLRPTKRSFKADQTCHSTQIEQFSDPIVKERIHRGRQTNILIIEGALTSA